MLAQRDALGLILLKYSIIQTYRADTQYLGKIYKEVSQQTPNEFSSISADKIKDDFAYIYGL